MAFASEMEILYRPNFCANCGEKVERAEWRLWTSGRYCEVCATEHKGRELIPRVIIGGAALALIASGISLVTGGRSADQAKLVPATAARQLVAAQPRVQPTLSAPAPAVGSKPAVTATDETTVTGRPAVTSMTPPVIASVPVYMCGAETRKGTACTRRVKGKVRCWQHTGMPPMVAQEKLRVS